MEGLGTTAACRKRTAFTFIQIGISLEVGCAEGNLLATLQPARGVGLISQEMMPCKEGHPELEFIHADAHDLSEISEKFDIIILSDLVNDLWDVQRVFDQVSAYPLQVPAGPPMYTVTFGKSLWLPHKN